MTSAAEARRSLAITRAPVRREGPSTTAQRPSSRIFAPMRTSSATCWKRFSKIVSVIVATPSSPVENAIHWAWRSVGNPGYGAVATSCDGSAARGAHAQRVAVRFDADPGRAESRREGAEVRRRAARDADVARASRRPRGRRCPPRCGRE